MVLRSCCTGRFHVGLDSSPSRRKDRIHSTVYMTLCRRRNDAVFTMLRMVHVSIQNIKVLRFMLDLRWKTDVVVLALCEAEVKSLAEEQ